MHLGSLVRRFWTTTTTVVSSRPCVSSRGNTRLAMTTSSAAASKPLLRGVVFDMDGTLTIPNLDFAEMYHRCGVDRSDDILRAIAAMSVDDAAKANAIVEEMEEEGRRTLQLMPGAVPFLQWLAHHQIPTALVTRNTHVSTLRLVELLQQEDPTLPAFSPVISRDFQPEIPPKPHHAALEEVAREWKLDLSESIVMVGDSPANDIVFGKNAGVSTALLWQREPVTFSPLEQADVVVSHLAHLPNELCKRYDVLGQRQPTATPAPEPSLQAAKAAFRGDLDLLKCFSIDELLQKDENDNTALIWACEAGHGAVVSFLLETLTTHYNQDKKYDDAKQSLAQHINARGYRGSTAVSRAVRHGHVAVLETLLQHPITNANIPNVKLQYPLHIAAFRQHHAMVDLLLQAGADPHAVDHKGRTPTDDTSCPNIRKTLQQAIASQVAI